MPDTKACNLTEFEIRHLIAWLGSGLYTHEEPDTKIERINYLNRRLKTFKEPEAKIAEETPKATAAAWPGANNG